MHVMGDLFREFPAKAMAVGTGHPLWETRGADGNPGVCILTYNVQKHCKVSRVCVCVCVCVCACVYVCVHACMCAHTCIVQV